MPPADERSLDTIDADQTREAMLVLDPILQMTARAGRCPSHPGDLLRAILAAGLQLSVAVAARQLGVSRMTLHRLLRGEQAVTPELALRLGKLRGNRPALWLRMQMTHDLWRAERTLRAALTRIPTHRAA